MKMIYLDHASTTPVDPRVANAMMPFFSGTFGNPSSFHGAGMAAKEAMTAARRSIARLLHAHEDEILFTSGGTESDNLAILGIARAYRLQEKSHIITSAIEHHAVLEPLLHLQKNREIDLTIVPVDRYGLVSVQEIADAIRPTTVLVSIMAANNEIGTVEPIADIGRMVLRHRQANASVFPFFHTDACQAAGVLDLDMEKIHADLFAMNASKIYGPKGIGALFVRRGVRLEPMIRGGGQERALRSGTENVPAIVGLAKAFMLAQDERENENARLTALRDRLTKGLLRIPKTLLNGHPALRLPNNVNVSFLDIEGEAAILYLDAEGIMASTGSACASASLDPSHVIRATGLSYEAAHGSIRFTLGRSTTEEDVDQVIRVMPAIVERLRSISPVHLDMKHFV